MPVTRLDDSQLRAPKMVKIDAEGAEFAVLGGMRKLLAMHRPAILRELHNFGSLDLDAFTEALGDSAGLYDVAFLEQHTTEDAWAPHVLAVPRRAV